MFPSKNRKAVRYILVFLFCTALLLIELNNPGIDPDSGFSHSSSAGELSKTPSHNKKADAIAEVSGNLADEITANISSISVSTFSFRVLPLKYIFLKTVLLYIPLILWTLLTILLQNGYINRRFMISFIHNSDGEKGEAASI